MGRDTLGERELARVLSERYGPDAFDIIHDVGSALIAEAMRCGLDKPKAIAHLWRALAHLETDLATEYDVTTRIV